MKESEAWLDFIGIQIDYRNKQPVIKKKASIEHEQKNEQEYGSHLGEFLDDGLHIQQKSKDAVHDNNGEIENQKFAWEAKPLVSHPLDFPFEQRIIA